MGLVGDLFKLIFTNTASSKNKESKEKCSDEFKNKALEDSDFSKIHEQFTGIKYYTLVGMRAIPAFMPVFYLLKKKYNQHALVTLIYTNNSIDVANRVESLLIKLFPERIKVIRQTYDSFINNLKSGKFPKNTYFNLTPGMNWQVAETVLYLPSETTCINLTYRYIYTFALKDTIEKACIRKIDTKLTLKNYMFLNPDIEIVNTTQPHRFVKMYNFKEQKGFIINRPLDDRFKHWINHSLVWVQEKGGFLYFLFDLTSNGIHNELKAKNDIRNPALCLYRMILGSFDPLNYGITIITNNSRMRYNAERDGVHAIKEDEKMIKDWLKRPPEPKKKPIKKNVSITKYRIKTSKWKSALILCLGDNVISTLKAIKSHRRIHNIDRVFLFYDARSERIKSLARHFNDELIQLKQTDHMGSGITKNIDEMIEQTNGQLYFNITPGSKAQTIALTHAARKHNLLKRVFSIKENKIVTIYDNEVAGNVEPIAPNEIIGFYCPKYEQKAIDLESSQQLWDSLLKGFAKNELIFKGRGLKGITDRKGENLFEFDELKVYHKGIKKWFRLPEEKYKEEKDIEQGWWWELVTYYAIVKHRISEDVVFSVLCKDEREWEISEIDLVFSYNAHVVALSCKTAVRNIDIEALQLVSEAKSRFGRMAVCFICVPINKKFQTIRAGSRTTVRVIDARDLYDAKKLHKIIQKHISTLSTTKKQ